LVGFEVRIRQVAPCGPHTEAKPNCGPLNVALSRRLLILLILIWFEEDAFYKSMGIEVITGSEIVG